jgi:hypothetical protein
VDAAVIVTVTLVALWELHPDLLLAATTTTGGDTGAHVALPAFLRSDLLPHFQLTGWDPGWYDGFPVYTFYFPLPGVLAALLSFVIPYDIAFKLVTVAGTLTLPVSAWAFGRLAGLRDPGPAALAAFTLPFLFEPSFSIVGGNILSTLAGEFSFSLGLSLALVFLGVVADGLHNRRRRVAAALLLAATMLCHLVTGIFAVAGALVWLALDRDLLAALAGRQRRAARRWGRRLVWLAGVGLVGAALTAWWLVPFAADQAYTTNMGWQNVGNFPHLLFPSSARWVLALDLVAAALMVVRRNRVALFLAVLGGLSAAALCLDPQGKLYNVRFQPLWFLCLYLFAGWGVGEAVAVVARALRRHRLDTWSLGTRSRMPRGPVPGWRPGMRFLRSRRPSPPSVAAGGLAGGVVALAAACLAVVPPMVLSPSTLASIGVTVGADQPSAWAAWNYSGYQRKPDYPEYRAVVAMMTRVGATDGCGRAMWEYDPALNRFGTTMSLMLLPYWTNGCIDSMEGLLFESSATTPYHFLDQSELSATPSDAMSGLPYAGLDVPLGIRHLQMLGVRYLLVSSPSVESQVAADPSATLLARTGPWATVYDGQPLRTTWEVYRIAGTSMVVPLTNRPVVWTGVPAAQTGWLAPSVAWYQHPDRWSVVPAAGGPAAWPRVRPSTAHPAAVPEPPTTVSAIRVGTDTVRFHVDRTGTPVEVRISYFPNWHATGAEGPWRVAPNLMVILPTSHEVTLHYGASGADVAGWLLTAAGAAVVAGWIAAVIVRRRRAAALIVR